MKRILVILLSFIYLATTSGAVLHFHYCMGKMAQWSLTNENGKTCQRCGMEKKSGKDCCHDEHKVVKIHIDQSPAIQDFTLLHPVAVFQPVDYCVVPIAVTIAEREKQHPSKDPPERRVPLFLRNCTLLI